MQIKKCYLCKSGLKLKGTLHKYTPLLCFDYHDDQYNTLQKYTSTFKHFIFNAVKFHFDCSSRTFDYYFWSP